MKLCDRLNTAMLSMLAFAPAGTILTSVSMGQHKSLKILRTTVAAVSSLDRKKFCMGCKMQALN